MEAKDLHNVSQLVTFLPEVFFGRRFVLNLVFLALNTRTSLINWARTARVIWSTDTCITSPDLSAQFSESLKGLANITYWYIKLYYSHFIWIIILTLYELNRPVLSNRAKLYRTGFLNSKAQASIFISNKSFLSRHDLINQSI